MKKSIIVTFLLSFFLVGLIFAAINRLFLWDITSYSLIIFGDIFLLFIGFVWVSASRGKYFNAHRAILPFLLNVSLLFYLLVYPTNWINYFIIILVNILFFVNFRPLELGEERGYAINISSFVSWFLFLVSIYSLSGIADYAYWLPMLLLVFFSLAMLWFKAEGLLDDQNQRKLFVVLGALLILEFFLASLSWPIESIFIKSLLMVLAYYIYWSIMYSFLTGNFGKKHFSYFGWVLFLLLAIFAIALLIKTFL